MIFHLKPGPPPIQVQTLVKYINCLRDTIPTISAPRKRITKSTIKQTLHQVFKKINHPQLN